MHTPQFTSEAKQMLAVLSEQANAIVMEKIDPTAESVTGDHIATIIRTHVSTVKDLMQLVKPGFMRKAVDTVSTPSHGNTRRCVENMIAGIRDCAFSMTLADDILGI